MVNNMNPIEVEKVLLSRFPLELCTIITKISVIIHWYNASISGNLDVIKWLHKRNIKGCTYNTMDYASENGHLDIVKWLHKNRTEGCCKIAMNSAAVNGRLDIIKWLHKNSPWIRNTDYGCSTRAMDGAAHNGHLNVIKWLHKNRTEGCTDYAIRAAAYNNHLNVVKWLNKNRAECSFWNINISSGFYDDEVIAWEKKETKKWIKNIRKRHL